MYSFVIEERACAKCGNRRTVRFGRTWYCFNCGYSALAIPHPFSAAEEARLRSYRDAVQADFYTDNI